MTALQFLKHQLKLTYIVPDMAVITASLYLSLLIRVSPAEYPEHFSTLGRLLPIFLFIKIGVFVVSRIYDIIWRYVSVSDALVIFRAVFISSLIMVAATYYINTGRIPRSYYIIDAALTLILMMGTRLSWRIFVERSKGRELRKSGKRTFILGAGENGRTLASRFRTDADLGLQVLGFIDDDPQKIGMNISGIPVLGSTEELSLLAKKFRIEEVIVSTLHFSGETLTKVLETLRTYNIKPKIMSTLKNEVEAEHSARVMRPVGLSDLLKRPPRVLDSMAANELIKDKVVLITGAGGSIGSEIARQVLSKNPSQLILLDHSEYNLYTIDQELKSWTSGDQKVFPLLLDLKDQAAVQRSFQKHSPQIVFHAAAYKHVHLVEENPHSAILNNILGLKHLLAASEKCAVQNFVLISSDKAVNPVGVMGATKRVCELMVTDLGRRLKKNYCSVRFGNVLGSSGSLIPLLKKQIEAGEPITLTHPEMNRFFMLIPEAVSLVLRAATIAAPGDITILKMGDPIKIVDVAKSLLILMGLSEKDNPIVFTGTRSGEKLFEELYINGDEVQTTEPDILIAKDGDKSQATQLTTSELNLKIQNVLDLAASGDPAGTQALFDLVR